MDSRSQARDERGGVDLDAGEARDVEQHAAVAYVIAGPAMGAGADTDGPAFLPGRSHRVGDIVGGPCLHDDRRIAVDRACVPATGAPRVFVSRFATAKNSAGQGLAVHGPRKRCAHNLKFSDKRRNVNSLAPLRCVAKSCIPKGDRQAESR